MIRLTELRLHNFCQHADRAFDISPGLVGVLGPNGRGKTNMSSTGLMFALTGQAVDGSGRRWKREELLRHGESKGYAELVFDTADGREARVRWGLPGNAQRLDVEGDKPATAAADIRERLQELYGMPVDDVAGQCFLRQKAFSAFVDLLPNARADELKSLFSTLDTDAAMGEIQQVINGLGAVVDYAPAITAARTELDRAHAEAVAADAAASRAASSTAAARPSYEAALGRLQLPVVGDSDRLKSEAQEVVGKAQAALDAHKAAAPRAVEKPPEPRADGAELGKLLAKYSSERLGYDRQLAQLDAKRAQIAALVDESDMDALSRHEASSQSVRQFQDSLASLNAKRATLNTNLDFATKGGACPVFGGVCPSLPTADRLFEMRREVERVDIQKGECEARLAVEVEWDDSNLSTLRAIQQRNSANAGLRRSLSGDVAALETELSRLESWLGEAWTRLEGFDDAAYAASVSAMDAWRAGEARRGEHAQRELVLASALDAARIRLADSQRPQVGITRAEHEAAQSAVDAYRALEAAQAAAQKSLANAMAAEAGKAERLGLLERAADESRATALVRDDLDLMRQFFHRSNGPAFVLRSNLARYNQALAVHLDSLGFGLRAWVGEDFELVFDKPEAGAFGLPGSRLSGAEGVAVALAERLARRDVTACQVPLLVLDEPAAALSRDNVPVIVQLFERLRSNVNGKVTVLVPSHAAELEPCFERIIRI